MLFKQGGDFRCSMQIAVALGSVQYCSFKAGRGGSCGLPTHSLPVQPVHPPMPCWVIKNSAPQSAASTMQIARVYHNMPIIKVSSVLPHLVLLHPIQLKVHTTGLCISASLALAFMYPKTSSIYHCNFFAYPCFPIIRAMGGLSELILQLSDGPASLSAHFGLQQQSRPASYSNMVTTQSGDGYTTQKEQTDGEDTKNEDDDEDDDDDESKTQSYEECT